MRTTTAGIPAGRRLRPSARAPIAGGPAAVRGMQLATCLSLEAGVIHLWYTPESFMEWWGYGLFFLAATVGQIGYGPLLLWRPRVPVVLAGVWANAGILGLYLVTRIWGIPMGPHVEVVESVGLLDLATLLCELVLVVVLVGLLDRRRRRGTVNGLMLLGAVLWALQFVTGTLLP